MKLQLIFLHKKNAIQLYVKINYFITYKKFILSELNNKLYL